MKHLIKIIILAIALNQAVLAEKPTADSVRDLMMSTGAGEMGMQIMNQMMASFQQSMPAITDAQIQEFMKEFNADELVEMVIPIYQKHLTQEDIDALNVFFNSPAGKNFVKAQPAIVQESMMAGQMWGQQVAQKVMQKLQAAEGK